jgi:uncharacterized protein
MKMRQLGCFVKYILPVISVLTEDALSAPHDMFEFYRAHGIRSVGFNMEEEEGVHVKS